MAGSQQNDANGAALMNSKSTKWARAIAMHKNVEVPNVVGFKFDDGVCWMGVQKMPYPEVLGSRYFPFLAGAVDLRRIQL